MALNDVSTPEALSYIDFRLERLGVPKMLAKAGAREGDVIWIGEEFGPFLVHIDGAHEERQICLKTWLDGSLPPISTSLMRSRGTSLTRMPSLPALTGRKRATRKRAKRWQRKLRRSPGR